jgi:hypothetical protein
MTELPPALSRTFVVARLPGVRRAIGLVDRRRVHGSRPFRNDVVLSENVTGRLDVDSSRDPAATDPGGSPQLAATRAARESWMVARIFTGGTD